MTNPKILTLKDVDPQHLSVRVTDVLEGTNAESVIMTHYTGTLNVGHGTGRGLVYLTIQVPVIALLRSNPPPNQEPGVKAIFAFDDERFIAQFRGAIAEVSLASSIVKDDGALIGVVRPRADLRYVELDDQYRTRVLCVVLTFDAQSQQSEVAMASYHVTVLTDVNQDLPQRIIREGDNGWTGKFTQIDPWVVVPGVPHP